MKPYDPNRISNNDSKTIKLSLDEILRRKAERREETKQSGIRYFLKILIIAIIILGGFVFLLIYFEYSSSRNPYLVTDTRSYIQDVIAFFKGESTAEYSITPRISANTVAPVQTYSSPAISSQPAAQILPVPQISSETILVGSVISFNVGHEELEDVEVLEIRADSIRVMSNSIREFSMSELPEDIRERLRNSPRTSFSPQQLAVISPVISRPSAVASVPSIPAQTPQLTDAAREQQSIDERIKLLNADIKRLYDEENTFAKNSMINLSTNQPANRPIYYLGNGQDYHLNRTKQIESYRQQRKQIEDQIKELQIKKANLPSG